MGQTGKMAIETATVLTGLKHSIPSLFTFENSRQQLFFKLQNVKHKA